MYVGTRVPEEEDGSEKQRLKHVEESKTSGAFDQRSLFNDRTEAIVYGMQPRAVQVCACVRERQERKWGGRDLPGKKSRNCTSNVQKLQALFLEDLKSFFGVSCVTSRICLIDIRRKSHVLLFLTRKDPYKSSGMTSWHPKSAKMTPRGQDFA